MVKLTDSEITILKSLKDKYNGDYSVIKTVLKNNIDKLKVSSVNIQDKINGLKENITGDPTYPYNEHDPSQGSDMYYAQLLYWRKVYDRTLKKINMLKHIEKIPSITTAKLNRSPDTFGINDYID